MLVATGSFSSKRELLVNVCVDFNHFKSIVMSSLLHNKTEIFISEQLLAALSHALNGNLIYSSHLYEFVKMIKMWRNAYRKFFFTPAAIW